MLGTPPKLLTKTAPLRLATAMPPTKPVRSNRSPLARSEPLETNPSQIRTARPILQHSGQDLVQMDGSVLCFTKGRITNRRDGNF